MVTLVQAFAFQRLFRPWLMRGGMIRGKLLVVHLAFWGEAGAALEGEGQVWMSLIKLPIEVSRLGPRGDQRCYPGNWVSKQCRRCCQERDLGVGSQQEHQVLKTSLLYHFILIKWKDCKAHFLPDVTLRCQGSRDFTCLFSSNEKFGKKGE